jgi:hypothetical protein
VAKGDAVALSTRTGLAGEFIVCSSILRLDGDWKVVHTPQDKIDILAFNDEGMFLRVQVKTSTLKTNKPGHRPFYHFQNGSGCKNKSLPTIEDMDIVAHCFLDERTVAYYATEQVRQYSQRRPMHYASAPGFEQDTWDKALQIVQDRMR